MGKRKKEQPELFEVEVILAAKLVPIFHRTKKRRRTNTKREEELGLEWQYHVKWVGYPHADNTWEPESSFQGGCRQLLSSFRHVVGIDQPQNFASCAIGQIVRPPDSWIKEETERYEEQQAEEFIEEEDQPASSNAGTSQKDLDVSDEEQNDLEAHMEKQLEDTEEPYHSLPTPEKTPAKELAEEPPPQAAIRSQSISLPISPSRPVSQGIVPDSEPPEDVPPDESRRSQSPSSLFSVDEVTDIPDDPEVPVTTELQSPPASPSYSSPVAPSRIPPYSRVDDQHAKGLSAGIPAKQRIAKNALDLLSPQEVVSNQPARPHAFSPMPTGSSSIMATGFRRTLPGILTGPSAHPAEPTLASLNASQSPQAYRTNYGDVPPVISPIAKILRDFRESEVFDQAELDLGDEMPVDQVLQYPDEMPVDQVLQYPSVSEVDMSLSSIVLPEYFNGNPKGPINAPYPAQSPEQIDLEVEVVPSALPPSRSDIALPEQEGSPNWKWTGALVVSCGMAEDQSDIRFNVTIDDAVELRPAEFRFSVVLGMVKELRIKALYDVIDLVAVIRASKPPAYHAQLSLQAAGGDSKVWETILKYMTKGQRVALIPLHLDNNLVGHMVLHSTRTNAFPGLTPDPAQLKDDVLVAWLLPWSLNQNQISLESRQWASRARDEGYKRYLRTLVSGYNAIKAKYVSHSWNGIVKHRPIYNLALSTQKFPLDMHRYLRTTSRTWAICVGRSSVAAKSKTTIDLESRLLISILQRIRRETPRPPNSSSETKNVQYPRILMASAPERAGMLFMHTAALRNLDEFPFLVERLLCPEYVRVYMFGSHPSLPPSWWGVREIYPCGGIVTLTPSAILRNPLDLRRSLKNISEHSLWDAYVLPVVIGMAAALWKVSNPEATQAFPLPFLLNAIARGDIALLEAPPDENIYAPPNDQRQVWLRNHIRGAPPSGVDALSRGLAAFQSVYANYEPSEWESRVEKEVENDLKRMQRQPSLFADYRRYLVLDGNTTGETHRGSIEWIAPDMFDFKDRFNEE